MNTIATPWAADIPAAWGVFDTQPDLGALLAHPRHARAGSSAPYPCAAALARDFNCMPGRRAVPGI